MSKQTAVEWLQDNLKEFFQIDFAHLDYMTRAFEQAKAMEKEQIMEAYKHNSMIRTVSKAEQYYNETYGGDK